MTTASRRSSASFHQVRVGNINVFTLLAVARNALGCRRHAIGAVLLLGRFLFWIFGVLDFLSNTHTAGKSDSEARASKKYMVPSTPSGVVAFSPAPMSRQSETTTSSTILDWNRSFFIHSGQRASQNLGEFSGFVRHSIFKKGLSCDPHNDVLLFHLLNAATRCVEWPTATATAGKC